ncbi:MAG: HD family phosphohydrolase [Anaerolineae bacterium]
MDPASLVGDARQRVRRLTQHVPVVDDHSEAVAFMLSVLLVVGLTAILLTPTAADQAALEVGVPSPGDLVAPYSASFASQVLTERARSAAEQAVEPVFTARDPTLAAQQRGRAREVLQHIRIVRGSPYMDDDQKLVLIAGVPELASFTEAELRALLALDDAVFASIEQEVPSVVGLKMRSSIRPDGAPVTSLSLIGLVDPGMDDATAETVARLAAVFVAPNTRIDEELTAAARQAARDQVAPTIVSFAAGQTIVRDGDPIEAEHIEALEQYGLLRESVGWQDILGVGALVAALVAVFATSLGQLKPGYYRHTRSFLLVVLSILIFAFGARFAVPGHVVLGYAYPAAALGMTLTVLLGLETGLLVSLLLAVIIGIIAGGDLEMAVFVLLGSVAGSVVLGHVERFSAFLFAGLAVASVGIATIAGFRVADPSLDLRGASELISAAAVNAALSTGLAALGALGAGALFGVTTSLQLLEIARPNHPLLRQLQLRAPGTYQHSIQIANLAEAAAAAIGADALLVRVGAYYHDVGKIVRPYFFVENQLTGQNPHDGLDPYASARIIISHVPDGVDLAQRHGLPPPIIDAILQHHGTMRAEYFYYQAAEQLGEERVEESAFRYPGPRPQTPEMAILMLADAAEAAVRAESPKSTDEIEQVLGRIFQSRLSSGQLQDSDITLSDLQRIREAFLAVFKSIYHPRIQYPAGIAPAPTEDVAEGARPAELLPADGEARD